MIYNVRNNQYQVRDANPEYDSVEASQGTKVCDKNSPKNQVEKNCQKTSHYHVPKYSKKPATSEQAIDLNSDYEPSSIYDSMENDQKDIRVMFSSSIW